MDKSVTAQYQNEAQSSVSEWTTGVASTESVAENVSPRDNKSSTIEDENNGQLIHDTMEKMNALSQSPPSPALPPNYDEAEDQAVAPKFFHPTTAKLSDKFGQLAAVAWTLEQDEAMDINKRKKINTILYRLEQLIEEDGSLHLDEEEEEEVREEVEEEDYMDEEQLHHIHDSLLSTVNEMRMRTQEQKHLHSLTTNKLDAITARCMSQAQQVSSLTKSHETINLQITNMRTEYQNLHQENHIIGAENDTMRLRNEELEAHIKALEAEVQRQSVALTAMTSAITGLEEWMDYSKSSSSTNTLMQSSRQRPSHNGDSSTGSGINNRTGKPHLLNAQMGTRATTKPRTIVRGVGRFRGRYQVDIDDDGEEDHEDNNHGFARSPYSTRNNKPHSTSNGNYFHDYTPSPNSHHEHYANEYSSDLQDDVRAWIRGCRDVLECAQAGAEALPFRLSTRHGGSEIPARSNGMVGQEDEWGEFETAQKAV